MLEISECDLDSNHVYYSKKFLYICLCFLFFYLIKNWWEIRSLLEKIKLLLISLFLNLTFHFEHSWLIIHLQWNGQFNFCSLILSLLDPLVTIGNQTYNTMLQFTSFFLENIYSSSVKCFFYFVIINLWKKKVIRNCSKCIPFLFWECWKINRRKAAGIFERCIDEVSEH